MLGPGVPDLPRGVAVLPKSEPRYRRLGRVRSQSRNRSWEVCITNIPLRGWARARDGRL